VLHTHNYITFRLDFILSWRKSAIMARPPMQNVFSSHVNSIGYDEPSGELHVTFSTGRTAVYQGVPPKVARDVMEAPSIGEAMWRQIRGHYEFGYLRAQR